ncbi:hypothetical protein [Victivallis sp. Marseille-Q1083]|uniref:hypothetical protein n=1 Tax=Victivallis sp. Marseille-Q1083 TaxID=2717288 RepID=UPI00158DD130|nr:hypothetical protein [Victivallis sp. Marseille-Q1083]
MVKKLIIQAEVAAESPELIRRIALLRSLGMLNSALWALAGWVVFRLPDAGLISVIGPTLATCGATTEPTRRLRRNAILLNILSVAVIQFIRANLSQQSFLVLPAIFLIALAVHRLNRSAMSASAIMVAGLLDINYTPYQVTADIFLTLALVAVLASWSYWLLDLLILKDRDTIGFNRPERLSWESAFRRAMAFSIAYYLVQVTGWHESFWILLTVGLTYLNGDIGRKVRHTALLRYLWAPVGLWFAVIVLSVFAYQDYHFSYLAPLIGWAAFYSLYRTGEYVLFYLLFMIMLSLAINLNSGGAPHFGNTYNYLFQSTLTITIGAAIVILLELRKERPPNCPISSSKYRNTEYGRPPNGSIHYSHPERRQAAVVRYNAQSTALSTIANRVSL